MQFEWLKKIESEIPEILKVVKSCDSTFQPKCFELLLSHALSLTNISEEKHPIYSEKIIRQKDDQIQKTPTQNHRSELNEKFLKFLSKNELNIDNINNLIDLETGDIIATNLGNKGSEISRNIAVLLALWHCSIDGDFSFKMSELKQKTKTYGVQFHNHKRDLLRESFEGKKVFIENGDIWKIPTPTQDYIAITIKQLI
jgi:hypothetical protein